MSIIEKEQLREKLKGIVSEAILEVLQDNGIKEAVKQSVKDAVVQRVCHEAEKEALSLVNELLGTKKTGSRKK